MRKMSMFFLVIFVFCQQKSAIVWQEGSWSNFLEDDKLIMVDFWGTTCRPCHRLFDETFVNPDIVTFANTHFNSFKIDAWLPENLEIKKEYQIKGVPTLVFINAQGQEVDRLVGFRPADEMLLEWKRIVKGVDTYPALKKAVEEDSENSEKWILLAKKLNSMRPKGDGETMQCWARVQSLLPVSVLHHEMASIQLAIHTMWAKDNSLELEKRIATTQFFESQELGLNALVHFMQEKEDDKQEAEYHKLLAQKYVENKNQLDATTIAYRLNGYAWRMTELEMNLNDALMKIQLGLSVLPEAADPTMRAGHIDTEAEVLWKLGRSDDAIAAIDRALSLDPENKYYKKQKVKFFSHKDQYQ